MSVLLATTGRPDMAERCVRGIRQTAPGVEIVLAVDADAGSYQRLWALVDRLTYSEPFRGPSRAWNDALAMSHGDQLVLAADDLLWRDGWLEAAQQTMRTHPGGWGFVGFNDGHWGEELSTHYLVSRRMVRDVFGGVIAWECYHHSFNDTEANERARLAGRYAWCEDAHVEHEHWLFGDRSQDATDTRMLAGHGAYERIFHERRAAGFPNDYAPVVT